MGDAYDDHQYQYISIFLLYHFLNYLIGMFIF